MAAPESRATVSSMPVPTKGASACSKGTAWRCARTELDVVRYEADPERMAFVAELARRWCVLRDKPAADKRIALILANYPIDDSRIANGVGLDTLRRAALA